MDSSTVVLALFGFGGGFFLYSRWLKNQSVNKYTEVMFPGGSVVGGIPYFQEIIGNNEISNEYVNKQNDCMLNNNLDSCFKYGWRYRHNNLIEPSEY